MFPCSGCKRHILDSESTCPFCGVEQRILSAEPSRRVGAFVLATTMALGLSACARQVPSLDDGATTTSVGTTEPNTTNTPDTTDTAPDPTAETDTGTSLGTTDDSSSDSNNMSLSFYAGANDWTPSVECDPWQQDCPEGEKCVPYGSTGGNWDANKCVAILGDGQPGEACSYGGTVEATDDCGAESYCWDVIDVDGQDIGTCAAFCQGTPDAPVCPEQTSCLIANGDSITLCIPICDPVMQDCDPGLACYFYIDAFNCVWTTQDIPLGEPCSFINDCIGGTGCMPADVVPNCNGAACCASFCSLSQPDCPQMGTECAPFFEEMMAPDEYIDVGICIEPAP